MPDLYVVSSGETTLEAAKKKSLILINPATAAIKLRQLDISLGAAAAAEEVLFEVYRVETIGAAAGAASTPQLANEKDAASLSSGLIILTTEPTAVKVIAPYLVQPLGGLVSIPFPYGAEIGSKAGGARIGVRYTTPTGVAPKCVANLWFEE